MCCAFFDDRITARNRWLGTLHPAKLVLSLWRWWPPLVQQSYNQLQVMNKLTRWNTRRVLAYWRVYWPPILFVPVPLVAFLASGYIDDHLLDLPNGVFSFLTALFWDGGSIWLVAIWFVFFAWSGWLPLLGLSLLVVPGGYNDPATLLIIVPLIAIALQKGYFSVWRRDWFTGVRNHVLVDTRLSQGNWLITQMHPAIFIPRIIQEDNRQQHSRNP